MKNFQRQCTAIAKIEVLGVVRAQFEDNDAEIAPIPEGMTSTDRFDVMETYRQRFDQYTAEITCAGTKAEMNAELGDSPGGLN